MKPRAGHDKLKKLKFSKKCAQIEMSVAYHGGLRRTKLDASPDQVIDENETGREGERILSWEMNEGAAIRETWHAEKGKMDLR